MKTLLSQMNLELHSLFTTRETCEVIEGLMKDGNYFIENAPNQEEFSTDGPATERVTELLRSKLE